MQYIEKTNKIRQMKKLNFAFEWIGPTGPVRNNDRFSSNESVSIYELLSTAKFIPNVSSTYQLPHDSFLYELLITDDLDFVSAAIDKLISQNVVDRLRSKTCWLILNNPYESFLQDQVLLQIHSYFYRYNIPISQIIYSTCCPNAQDIYNEFCLRYQLTAKLTCEFTPIYSVNFRTLCTDKPHTDYRIGSRDKDFLCLNKRYRDHRLLLGLLLESNNLMDRCYISMHDKSFANDIGGKRLTTILGITDDIIDRFSNRLPLLLDDLISDDLRLFYDNSLVHIISETNFFTNIIHQTEKSLKPIANLQPFIMMGSPHSLQYLRTMGYKTFGEFWDESYDDETDHNQRLLRIVELCKSIAQWSSEHKVEFTRQVRDIVQYNYQHFIQGDITALSTWMEKYGC